MQALWALYALREADKIIIGDEGYSTWNTGLILTQNSLHRLVIIKVKRKENE